MSDFKFPPTFLEDLEAFCRFSRQTGRPDFSTACDIAHDIGGLVRAEECFSPRCTGYAERERVIREPGGES